MNENMYSVSVSSLEVRKVPSESSKIHLTRNTIVKMTGKTKQYHKEIWCEIMTLTDPIICGYVNRKYLNKI